MANVKNFITAKDAKTLTRTSQKPLNVAFRAIRDQAEYGMNYLTYCVANFDPAVVENVTAVLTEAGYKVVPAVDDGGYPTLEIRW